MEELRDAQRNNGYDRDLVQGLHQSYSKQIENLVLDLSEARREVKELKLKQPLADAIHIAPVDSASVDPALEEVDNRALTMRLTFENLGDALAVAELSVPHPGPSLDALLRILSFTVKNHLQTLRNTANFFICRPREEHVEAALKIRDWYNSALVEKVHFSFSPELAMLERCPDLTADQAFAQGLRHASQGVRAAFRGPHYHGRGHFGRYWQPGTGRCRVVGASGAV